MNRTITFRGMEHSSVIEKFIDEKLEKLNRILKTEDSPVYLEFVLDAERDHHHHHVQIRIKTPHYHLISHYETQDIYDAINTAIDRMDHELAKAIDKLDDERKKSDIYHGT